MKLLLNKERNDTFYNPFFVINKIKFIYEIGVTEIKIGGSFLIP